MAVLALALAAGLTAAAARAQDGDAGEPLSLEPADTGSADTEPAADSAQPDGDTPADGSAPDTGGDTAAGEEDKGAGEGIDVAPLGDLDPATIGVLDPGGQGLGAAIWDGTPRHVVARLLPRIPAELHAPALRKLARRLLLSSTAPPERTRAGDTDGPDLLHARLRRLWAMGDTEGLLRLLSVVPREHRTAELARLRVQALFLRRDVEGACQRVRDGLGQYDHSFWQRALAVCQHHTGKPQQAALTVRLLREKAGGQASPFLALYDAVDGGADSLPLPERPGALTLALLAATDTPVPDAMLDGAGPGVLAAIAESPKTPLSRRARAAERAAAMGALPAERLGALYDRFSFESARLKNAASLTEEDAVQAMTPTRRRALYHQAARDESEDAVRAELIRQVMQTAEPSLYPALARLFAPVAAEMTPRAELAWFTGPGGRLLYVAGRGEAAGKWLQMAQGEAIVDPAAKAAVTALVPYARLAGAAHVPANGSLAAWRSATEAEGTTLAFRESVVRAGFQALEVNDARPWIEIAGAAGDGARPAPPAALLYALREAGRAGRTGETVLLSLVVLGESGLERIHPMVLGTALTALRRVELTGVARRIAIEAAAANGI
ncbi:hypothetical protein [Limimonas halophila]|uniref:hypothetical protein n=1 Tax=Limimonas halophila TaxID=1082479 RepID=UPI000B7D08CB|nr:hypothetical protein [Limimonas halophila]